MYDSLAVEGEAGLADSIARYDDLTSLYLGRCQVDTPPDLVEAVWRHVREYRHQVGKVVDFGAGDGRFSIGSNYDQYIGFEIDAKRIQASVELPVNAKILHECAFSSEIYDADLVIGNPPYVRNQDLPLGWREKAASVIKSRLGVEVSGLANAWQYFFFLSLASTKPGGIIALVVPYEWVSRPSAKPLRDYITRHNWNVDVFRLGDRAFNRVLTTACIAIVDTDSKVSRWRFFEESEEGGYARLPTISGSSEGIIRYSKRARLGDNLPTVKRGLSPGTQRVMTLTEGERVRHGLGISEHVVPWVTSLRNLTADIAHLNYSSFKKHFVDQNLKCWLIRTDIQPSGALKAYLDNVPEEDYQTSTCLDREVWWAFSMPSKPAVLIASAFRGKRSKVLVNSIGARAVGSVYGAYNLRPAEARKFVAKWKMLDLSSRVVSHSNGLKKIEVNQANTLLRELVLGEA